METVNFQAHQIPYIGAFFQNPTEQNKLGQFQFGEEALQAYRPQLAQARMNAMANQSQAFQSANNLLGHMSGGQGGFRGGEQMMHNPMSPGMMQTGAPAAMGGGGQSGGGGFDFGAAAKAGASSVVDPTTMASPLGMYGGAMMNAYNAGTGGGGSFGKMTGGL